MLQKLTLAQAGALTLVYAPFDYIEPKARIVVLGITPGRVQAENALKAARDAVGAGESPAQAIRKAKLSGSFSGTLRQNLVAMLDHIGLHNALKVTSCSELFLPGSTSVHFTSAVRYPVFVGGVNYNGSPDMLRTPLLRAAVESWLAAEVRTLPDALWLPLGPKPNAALEHLVKRGLISAQRILSGLPHPSGANNERISYFVERKPRASLSPKTKPEQLDEARRNLRARVAALVQAGAQ